MVWQQRQRKMWCRHYSTQVFMGIPLTQLYLELERNEELIWTSYSSEIAFFSNWDGEIARMAFLLKISTEEGLNGIEWRALITCPIQLQCLMTCLSSVPAGFIIGAMWINNGFSLTLIGFNYKKTTWYKGKISIYSLTCSWIIYRHTIRKINSNRSLTFAKNFNWPFWTKFLNCQQHLDPSFLLFS